MNNSWKTRLFDWWIWELTKYFTYFGWGVSSIFSFIGITAIAHLPFYMKVIAAVFAIGVNVIEAAMGRLSFDEMRHPKDVNALVLLAFGFFAYVYDILTNIAGFCFMFVGTPNLALAWAADKTLLVWPVIFGIMFAIGPEPLYRFYLSNTFPKPKASDGKPSYTQPTQKWTPPATPGPSKELAERMKSKYPDKFPK